jgi:hypothetical protein
VGDQTYTGAQLLAEAHLVGIGRGYVGADIEDMLRMLGKQPRKGIGYAAFMTKFNVHREDASRMRSYLNHRRNGDSPIEAGAKVIRARFDYTNDLTPFEKTHLRNLLMFYTWASRNTKYQASLMATRPGYTAAFEKAEAHREHFEDEPAYYAAQGALRLPLLGNTLVGSPVADAVGWLNPAEAPKKALTSLNPLLLEPIQQIANKDVFRDMPVDRTEITTPLGTLPGGGRVAHVLQQIGGPQLGTARAVETDPAVGGEQLVHSIRRILGLTPQLPPRVRR